VPTLHHCLGHPAENRSSHFAAQSPPAHLDPCRPPAGYRSCALAQPARRPAALQQRTAGRDPTPNAPLAALPP
jgi:hypothetical protein